MGRWGSFWKPGQGLPSHDHDEVAMPASSYMGMAGAYGSQVPDPLPEDQPVPEHRDNRRPGRFPARPGGDRGRPAHIIQPSPVVPDLPGGMLLYLASGEWSHGRGIQPSDHVVLRVAQVLPEEPRVDDRMVWLAGHRVMCRDDCGEPCVVLLASVEALWRAAGGR